MNSNMNHHINIFYIISLTLTIYKIVDKGKYPRKHKLIMLFLLKIMFFNHNFDYYCLLINLHIHIHIKLDLM